MVNDILDVKFLRPNHLRWPALDVGLSIEALEHPADFPLVYSG